MSGATSRADFVYFIKSASPALPNDEAFFMSNRRTRYYSLVRGDQMELIKKTSHKNANFENKMAKMVPTFKILILARL